LLGWAAANFPAMQERDLRPTAELWYRMLADLPYEVAKAALLKVLATAKYFPTVAEIREAAASIVLPGLPSPAEAWEMVGRVVRKYGYYREKEGLASLPPQVREAVRCIGWKEICLSEDIEVVRAQFFRVYEQYANRKREEAVIPSPVREIIGQLAERFSISAGERLQLPEAGDGKGGKLLRLPLGKGGGEE
jgi:hypothetical protein